MSEQIQYNYYSTVATKIGDNTFIFRGKRNMPNLVLQNGDSYVSAKLTIRSSDGLVEIEHEPITNYNKRVIATFPMQISIDIKIGESKEITLNSIIPKSLRFDSEESDNDNLIYLHPVAASASMGVEGFCNGAACDEIRRQLNETNMRLTKQESRSEGSSNMSTADYNALAAKVAAMNKSAGGGGGGGDGLDGGELVCTPITDSEDNEMTVVGVTMPLSGIDMAKATENSIYHQAAINVIMFIVGFFILSRSVSFAYTFIGTKLENKLALTGIELLCFVIVLVSILTIYLGFIKKPPSGVEDSLDKKKREDENSRLTYIVVILTILLLLFSYLIYDSRRQLYEGAKADLDPIKMENYKKFFGDRSLTGPGTFISNGVAGLVELYKEIMKDKPKPNQAQA